VLSAWMLVPHETEDDFGQAVKPANTLLRYKVTFGFSKEDQRLELRSEDLVHIKKGDARAVLGFPHSSDFRDSVVMGRRQGTAFISTKLEAGLRTVFLHGDGGSRGRPVRPGPSPRTILGGTGTKEYPTVVAARREMASWHSLHLEPSSLRAPDRLGERASIDEHGRHIAATLHRLGRESGDAVRTCAEVANQLARLVAGASQVRVREDPAREQYVVEVRMRDSDLWLPPRSLSDGTLRYLALVVMQMDVSASRLVCIEEPENGIHPFQLPDLLSLMRDFAVDPELPVSDMDNPLRQVILTSHSPEVAKQLDPSEILFVEAVAGADGRSARVRPVDHRESWRDNTDAVSIEFLKKWIGGAPRLVQGELPLRSAG